MDIKEYAAALRWLKGWKSEMEEAYEQSKAEFRQCQTDMLEFMEQHDIEGIKHDGVNFVPTKTIYGRITDRTKFLEWAKDNDDELVEDRERKAVLNERARQLIDDGEEFPPGMDFRVDERISQRSA